MLPRESDLRFNWAIVRLAAIDEEEMRALVIDAWAIVVPARVAAAYAEEPRPRLASFARWLLRRESSRRRTALVPIGAGWFVLNARDASWWHAEGRPAVAQFEGQPGFAQVGINLTSLEPGVAMAMYHWEADQEDFLVLAGEAVLIVEGEERSLRQWAFVHCPPETSHVIVGAGDGPCLVLAVGARERSVDNPDWVAYPGTRRRAGTERASRNRRPSRPRPMPGSVRRQPTAYRDGGCRTNDLRRRRRGVRPVHGPLLDRRLAPPVRRAGGRSLRTTRAGRGLRAGCADDGAGRAARSCQRDGGRPVGVVRRGRARASITASPSSRRPPSSCPFPTMSSTQRWRSLSSTS